GQGHHGERQRRRFGRGRRHSRVHAGQQRARPGRLLRRPPRSADGHGPGRRADGRGDVPLIARLALLAVLLHAVPAGAASAQLALARSQFAHGEYRKVVDTLEHELYPQAHITDEEELKEARYLLGTAQFFLDHRDKAREEFTKLLYLDP